MPLRLSLLKVVLRFRAFKAFLVFSVVPSATKHEMRVRKFGTMLSRMKRITGPSPARFLAMLAIILQAFLPGSMAVAESSGVDASRFMCAPSGEMSPETRAAAERIAKLLGEDLPDEQPPGDHCSLCTLVHGVPLPQPAVFDAPTTFAREKVFVRFEPGLLHQAQGPPLGSRGPPSYI